MRERVKHAEYVDGALMALVSVTDISKFAFVRSRKPECVQAPYST